MKNIRLKTIEETDLLPFWRISYGPEADLTWKKFDAPYFENPVLSWEAFENGWGKDAVDNPHRKIIMYEDKIVGVVTAYWEDGALEQWLEAGITIFSTADWGKGIGSTALSMWLEELFALHIKLPHIGFSTWSGNAGMQKAGEKCGMKKEAVIRKVRYWNGQYYDAIKYGILREE